MVKLEEQTGPRREPSLFRLAEAAVVPAHSFLRAGAGAGLRAGGGRRRQKRCTWSEQAVGATARWLSATPQQRRGTRVSEARGRGSSRHSQAAAQPVEWHVQVLAGVAAGWRRVAAAGFGV